MAQPAEKFLNPLLATAESEETVSTLLGHMLDGPPVETCLINGVEVLQALLLATSAGEGSSRCFAETVFCSKDLL